MWYIEGHAQFGCPSIFLAISNNKESRMDKKKKNKVSLQISLERNVSNFLLYLFCVNFENLIFEVYVPYVLNMHIKFHLNWIFFTIRSINLFFIYNFRS